MKIKRPKALEIVYAAIEETKGTDNIDGSLDGLRLEEETVLYGRGALLQSIQLVSLIVDIELRLTDELGVEVILADEKALSQKRSPFRTVRSLVDFISHLEVQP